MAEVWSNCQSHLSCVIYVANIPIWKEIQIYRKSRGSGKRIKHEIILVNINVLTFYLPTKFSKTELLPADWPPTTAICGKSSCMWTPNWVKASCNLFTIGISCSMPVFPAILHRVLWKTFDENPTRYPFRRLPIFNMVEVQQRRRSVSLGVSIRTVPTSLSLRAETLSLQIIQNKTYYEYLFF